MAPAIVLGSTGMCGQLTKKLPTTTSHMMDRIPIANQLHTREASHVCVTRKGTLFSNTGMNSANMAVDATTMRKRWRRLMAPQMPEKAFVGGERIMES